MNSLPSHQFVFLRIVIGRCIYLILRLIPLILLFAFGMETAYAVTISNTPLYLGTSALPNALLTLSNSQNMDENGNPSDGFPVGAAVGGSSPNSKSEIARSVIRNLVGSYAGQINMGLMTFQQSIPSSYFIYNSFYDASYNPANYSPTPLVAKNSTTKNYRVVNPADTSNYIYYNWPSPFYDNPAQPYPYNFCYSNTAKFDNTTNITTHDYYRCFNTKTGTSDGIVSPLPTSSTATSAEQNYGYSGSVIYEGYFVPTDTDYATNTLDFGAEVPSVYTATAWFSSTSPGGGYLQVPVAALTSSQQTAIDNKLTCNVPVAPSDAPNPNPTPTSAPCNSNSSPTGSSILNAGLTAIAGTLGANQLYFSGGTNSSEGFGTNTLPNSCHKNYAVLLTNGLPSVNAQGQVPKLSNGQVDICTLTSQAVAAASSLYSSGVQLYVVGYAILPQVLQNYTALCGNTTSPLDQLAIAGGTNQSYSASDATTLQATLDGVFNNIVQSAGSSSALSSNSTSINGNSFVYQASFNSTDWSGHLKAFSETATGLNTSPSWDAASLIPAPASRSIFTWNGTNGVSFSWSNLTATEQCYLSSQLPGCSLTATETTNGQNVLDYLLGTPVAGFRVRSTLLGDIMNSSPLYLSNDDYGYSILAGTEGSTYPAYVQNKTSNTPMLYVGANDGMLHGFNANTGVEAFGYVPSAVYAHLPDLTLSTYPNHHEYFVDGSPGSGDAYYAGSWHTILVGTMGATSGTDAIFSLDITNPGSMSAGNALWEVTDANDLGATWGSATVARFNDGHYYAVVNNGYNSVNKHAVLFLIQVDNPANIIKLDTGVGGGTVDNGLSAATLLDVDGNGTIDAIYAGDLQGNLWKFDVSGTTSNKWKVAFGSGTNKLPLFHAQDAAGNVQPITAPLQLGSVPNGATGTAIVFFGTGQYLNTTDLSNMSTQSLYGVLDSSTYSTSTGGFSGGTSNFNRTTKINGNLVLVKQSIIYESAGVRAVSTNTVDYTTGVLGWYMDLLQPPDSTQQGERVISKPIIRSGRVLFTTLIPATGLCTEGGSGWTLELDAPSGGSPTYTFLDLYGTGLYNSSDNVTLSNGTSAIAVGQQITGGFGYMAYSAVNGPSYSTELNKSSGFIQKLANSLVTNGNPRASWSQIK